MPAGITETDSMAYVGQKPWHDLGVKVEGDAMTAAEAIEATGMDWEVSLRPVYLSDKTKLEAQAVYRQDTKEVLAVVGRRYTPVQNTDRFNLFDSVIGTGEAKYDTVGTLQGGRKVWMLAKFANGVELDNGEKIDSYMLLTDSNDGSSALMMRWCDIRVVCQNTFEMAKRDTGDQKLGLERFYARHTSGIMGQANRARDILQLQNNYRQILADEINQLVDTAWSDDDMERLTYTVLKLNPEKGIADQNGIRQANGETMMNLFKGGVGNKGETAWDAYNAVTEFTSHYKGHGRSVDTVGATDESVVDNRLYNNWFGHGRALRNKTWEILKAPVDQREKLLVTFP